MSLATLAALRPASRPRLLLLPAPASAPPYDDERPPDSFAPATTGAMPLPFDPDTARRLRLVPASAEDVSAALRPAEARTPRSALPDPQPWAARLAQAVAEAIDEQRPLTQLARWVSDDVLDEVEARLHRLRTSSPRPPRRGDLRIRICVMSVHVCEPEDGVAEVCAVVRRGGRSTAMALRLEGADGRWLCTALQQ